MRGSPVITVDLAQERIRELEGMQRRYRDPVRNGNDAANMAAMIEQQLRMLRNYLLRKATE